MTVSSEDLSGELTLKTRDEIVQDFLNDFQVRTGSTAQAKPHSYPWIEAQLTADTVAPIYGDVQIVSDGMLAKTASGKRLEAICAQRGVTRPAAIGSTGYVAITASSGGTTIVEGDELVDEITSLRFAATRTGTFSDGESVPIRALSTGPETNLPIDTVLTWVSPRAGCGSKATVNESVDGEGLRGGRDAATDDELRRLYYENGKSQAASGNDADYQQTAKETPDVPVAVVFTYPAIKGSGTTAVVPILKPERPGGDRRPSDAQRAAVQGHVTGKMPGDDGAFFPQVLQQLVTVCMSIEWASGTDGWTDTTPWPTYSQSMRVTAAASATEFTVTGTGTGPTAGKTIGFYDLDEGVFVRKRILSVSGTGPWVITVDSTNSASDLAYVPVVNQKVSPWSDYLDLLVPPIVEYFEKLGPGEMKSSFYSAGTRQRRQPPPPSYPNTIQNRIVNGVQDLSAVSDASLLAPSVPYATTVGTPGATVYLLELGDLAFFKS